MQNAECRVQNEDKCKGELRMKKNLDANRSVHTFHFAQILSRLSFCTLHSALCTFLLPGCTVGPDYKSPKPDMPAAYLNPSAPPTTQTSTTTPRPIDVTRWWKTFNDPELDSLVERAVATNLDVMLAESRLCQARATVGIVGATLLPDVNATGLYNRSGAGKGNVQAFSTKHGTVVENSASRSNSYRAGFDANWEIDIFGGVRRNIESADASVQAAVEDRRDVLVTLISEVAVDYIALRGYQEQIRIATENLADQQHTADLTRQKFKAGFVSKLDVANADSQVYSTQSDIPALEMSARQTIYAMSVLLARDPAALLDELNKVKPIPLTPPDVPIGLPAELLRRRPDIRRAEAQLHAATAQIGVATAQLYPQLNLAGSLDIDASHLKGLGYWANNVWSVGPSITWPIFAGGKIVAGIDVQNALQEQALLTYKQTVLTALQDVENALVAYGKEQQRRTALVLAVAANQQAFDLSTQLYKQGQTDFLNVLNAERSLFGAQNALVQSNTNIATDLTALYKALGGGWEVIPEKGNVP